MAKLENTTVKKAKGKKRKHADSEVDDEVANKSVIVEAKVEEDEPMQTSTDSVAVATSKKSKKRKNKEKIEILEKRSKSEENEKGNEPASDEDGLGEDFHQPTHEEVRESEKPENNLAIVTGRQKKKQKHAKLIETQKDQSTEKEKLKNTQYLHKWKHSRDSWKFEKLRQISIQQSMFESDKVDDELWTIALEYLAGSKGSAKDTIVKLANNVIEEVDKLCEQQETDEEKQNIFSSRKYQRARELLQIFD